MKSFGSSPIPYFNRWLGEPILAAGDESVQSIIDSLNRHPLAQDETSSDYVMPAQRYRERPGRFRILGENQDLWYCFVYDGAETHLDPPVYFETCLDLKRDYGFCDADIIDGDHVLVCPGFSSFLWLVLGRQICIRMEGNGLYAPEVHGVVFSEPVKLDDSFINPLDRKFPAGYACYLSPDVICIPEWGAAFLNAESGGRFIGRLAPAVSSRWA